MVSLAWPDGPTIYLCRKSGGLWIDQESIRALAAAEKSLDLRTDPSVASDVAAADTAPPPSQTKRRVPPTLLRLPNLFLRSTATLVLLYGILAFVLIVLTEFGALDENVALIIGGILLVIQFVFGPFLMDWSLGFFYEFAWVDVEKLPTPSRDFLVALCEKRNMTMPRLGLIRDRAPQAFTYGHYPGNARVVLSQGLIDLLDDERNAVIAHEVGHALHWDMALMTVAQFVPLVLYYMYRTARRMLLRGRKKSKLVAAAVAVGAYVLYLISQYLVLWFSRTREYAADRFAGEATGKPSALASALVKIAYGLAAAKPEEPMEDDKDKSLDPSTIGALGIFDAKAAQGLAIVSGNAPGAPPPAKDDVAGAMRWDLWNPWAKWYELNSTHPLTANRLRYLSNQSESMGLDPYIRFNDRKPESYWDEFFADFVAMHLPHLVVVLAFLCVVVRSALAFSPTDPIESGLLTFFSGEYEDVGSIALVLFGAAALLRTRYRYAGGIFPDTKVSAVLRKVKVSAIRPVPCTLNGTIIGRGVPGLVYSEDFVAQDDTGIIYLDLRHWLPFWQLFFGLARAGQYVDGAVRVEGWYRRAPVPYIETKTLYVDGRRVFRSQIPLAKYVVSGALVIAGLAWMAAVFVGA